jgi:hypothetical protein
MLCGGEVIIMDWSRDKCLYRARAYEATVVAPVAPRVWKEEGGKRKMHKYAFSASAVVLLKKQASHEKI